MELESLKRQISFLRKNNIEINKLVTDRHTQVCAYIHGHTQVCAYTRGPGTAEQGGSLG